jgi:phenylacetate-CoA ligase
MNLNDLSLRSISKNIYFRSHILFNRNEIRNTDKALHEDLLKIQEKKWLRLARYAVRNVPFYRNYFERYKLKLEDIRSLDSLKLFPFIDKVIVRNNPDLFISDKYKKADLYTQRTAGSSGAPLVIYEPKHLRAVERAFHLENWERTGFIHKKSTLLSIRGRDKKASDGEIIKYEPSELRYSVSTFSLFQNIDEVIELLKKEKIEFIFTFPSTAEYLAAAILERELSPKDFPELQGLLLSSETINPVMRETITKAFNAKIFSHFGHTEKLILGGECPHSSDYHLFPTYGITELISERSENIIEPGIQGELTGTTLINYAMPLIRYRTGDYAEWSGRGCQCGRHYQRIKNVYGKYAMLSIYDCNYEKFNLLHAIRSAIYLIKDHPYEKFLKYQFVQDKPGVLKLNYIPRKDASKDDEEKVKINFRECFGDKFSLIITPVEGIMLDESGKQKLLIQNIKR